MAPDRKALDRLPIRKLDRLAKISISRLIQKPAESLSAESPQTLDEVLFEIADRNTALNRSLHTLAQTLHGIPELPLPVGHRLWLGTRTRFWHDCHWAPTSAAAWIC